MALSKLELAKSKIALHAGFWISLTSRLQFVPVPGMGGIATDGRRVLYDEDWFETLTLPQAIGVVLHEVGHNMLAHPARLGGRHPKLANIAMDITLNQLLEEYFKETASTLGAELPPGGLFGPGFAEFAGMNWEAVYAELEKRCKKNGKGKKGKKGEGDAEGEGEGDGDGDPGLSGKGFDEVQPGTNPDGTKQTEAEADALQKEWTMAAQQAATMAKARGKLPGMLEQFVSEQTVTRVNWRAQVRDEFTKVAKDEQSYRRFNRRFQHNEMYLPGMYSERIGLIRFYIDVSGSMGSVEFGLGLGAMNEIFEELKPEGIQVVQCDTRIVSDVMYKPDDLPIVAMDMKGRGGTTLTPMFEHNKQCEEEAEFVVILTDGYHEEIAASLAPSCATVWLVTTNNTAPAEASFGRVIQVTA